MKQYEITAVCFEDIDKRILNHEKAKNLARELTGCIDPIDNDDVIFFKGKKVTIAHNYYHDQWWIWHGNQVNGTSYGDDLQFIAKIEMMRKDQAFKPTINRVMLEEFIEASDDSKNDEWYGTKKEIRKEVIDQFFAWLDKK